MMQFEKVTHSLLQRLKSRGYNVLTSNNELVDYEIYWYPERVDSISNYIVQLIQHGYGPPLNRPMILWIEDALHNLREYELAGLVFVDD